MHSPFFIIFRCFLTVYKLKPTACEKYPTTHQKNRKLKNTTYTFAKQLIRIFIKTVRL